MVNHYLKRWKGNLLYILQSIYLYYNSTVILDIYLDKGLHKLDWTKTVSIC